MTEQAQAQERTREPALEQQLAVVPHTMLGEGVLCGVLFGEPSQK